MSNQLELSELCNVLKSNSRAINITFSCIRCYILNLDATTGDTYEQAVIIK
ncbi:hypothetical protein CSC2_49250 [Clostridium zeae]|uniref:Uncharacterized protein n=1 Tax=Clostridium zeae TaxID=2759022 RepID=A0ABQ1EHT8_9CLOT|nr:hypothetical protein CSC2_49250 [Clostridium zeae]